jgi:hypothetical protein
MTIRHRLDTAKSVYESCLETTKGNWMVPWAIYKGY